MEEREYLISGIERQKENIGDNDKMKKKKHKKKQVTYYDQEYRIGISPDRSSHVE
jgi:hypothetical protein